MKVCPNCSASYPNDFQICPKDQTALYVTAELQPGMIIRNKYIILNKIGSGGMASVYRAQHKAFDEIRAIKVVNEELASNEEFLTRFRTEARITRRLQHPNAVHVEDLDATDDGRPFIVMEYVHGKDLRQTIEQSGRLPIPRALNIASQVTSALAAAHHLGITHRDIKPDNILLTAKPDGSDFAKVLDFGIAKAREGSITAVKTRDGVLVGTPQYMSPEQAVGKRGDQIDGRSDLYSLGVVIYEMITGQLPFESDTPMGFLLKHLSTPPIPAHQLRPELNIPEPVSKLLMKAMEKEPEKRFRTAEDMLAALQNPDKWTREQDPAATVLSPIAAGSLASAAHAAAAPSKAPAAPMSSPPPPRPGSAPAPAAATPRVRYTPPVDTPERPVAEPAPAPKRVPMPPPPPARVERREPEVSAPPVRSSGKNRMVPVIAGIVVVLALVGGGLYWRSSTNAASTPIQPASATTTAPQPAVLLPAVTPTSDEIRTSIFNQVAALGDRFKTYEAANEVRVEVDHAKATLSGRVDSEADRAAIGEAATKTAGVKEVLNNIVVKAAAAPAVAEKPPAAVISAGSGDLASRKKPTREKPTREEKRVAAAGEGKQRLQQLVSSGTTQLDSGQYAAAVATFQQALALDKSNPTARSGLDRALKAQRTEDSILKRRQ